MTVRISKKVCLLGDFSVGKTSLVRRFVERQFSDQYLSTVGVKISQKTVAGQVTPQQGKVDVQMLIWDLEGNTKFKAITPMYLRGASSALVVADLSRQVTIEHIPNHIQGFLSVNPHGFVIIALNKADKFTEDELKKALNSLQLQQQDKVIDIYLTSAKTGSSVDSMFQKLADKMSESK
ncbi:MAG: Rab family GTPase [Coleofasciculaceae cyanobacterium]